LILLPMTIPQGTDPMSDPMTRLAANLRRNSLVRFLDHFAETFPDSHLKDLTVDELGADRSMIVEGRILMNFGSDSFLGLDQDPRLRDAIERGLRTWGTHNGASRAFASVKANAEAEERIASWLGTEAALIYPSVTLANVGALPALVGRNDLLVMDEHAHNSMQEGAKIATANGATVLRFANCDPDALEQVLGGAGSRRSSVVAVDGVFSMSGAIAPLAELNEVALRHGAVLYVDDAHATGTIGPKGRGTVPESLGSFANVFAVGSLSKAFSCLGGFIVCPAAIKELLKMRSNTYIFGGPVPPPYLEAIITVLDILESDEYELIRQRLDSKIHRLTFGLERLGLAVLGGRPPIVSVLVGDESETLKAGRFLFDRGYYVQSVVFPAVPYRSGVLRIQVNANHPPAAIDGLLDALGSLRQVVNLPGPEVLKRFAA
jgi:7-keto-8-aminopelargonate synthetase-like enzyme